MPSCRAGSKYNQKVIGYTIAVMILLWSWVHLVLAGWCCSLDQGKSMNVFSPFVAWRTPSKHYECSWAEETLLVGLRFICPCLASKMCGVFSNRILLCRYAGEPRVRARVHVILETASVSLSEKYFSRTIFLNNSFLKAPLTEFLCPDGYITELLPTIGVKTTNCSLIQDGVFQGKWVMFEHLKACFLESWFPWPFWINGCLLSVSKLVMRPWSMHPDAISLKLAAVTLLFSLESISRLLGRLFACLFGFSNFIVCVHMCDGQKMTYGSQYTPSTLWVLEIELRPCHLSSP